MYIIEIKPITWKTWNPHIAKDFLCFMCQKEIAVLHVTLQKGPVIVKLPICEICSKKEITEFEEVL